jgi:hypothetical protein
MGFFFAAAALPLTDITAAAVINMVFAACLKKKCFLQPQPQVQPQKAAASAPSASSR